MGYLFTWIGFTLLAVYFYKLQKRVLKNKIKNRQLTRFNELDYIERKGL